MEPDLFEPHDAAALVAIRLSMADRPLSHAELLSAFRSSGLLDNSLASRLASGWKALWWSGAPRRRDDRH